ncbi:MAG: hypothetical protein M5U28_40420 [Sandaracinaceae bacterium]|nr:hypothetical protein [Sandaracinaceae bacterium]
MPFVLAHDDGKIAKDRAERLCSMGARVQLVEEVPEQADGLREGALRRVAQRPKNERREGRQRAGSQLRRPEESQVIEQVSEARNERLELAVERRLLVEQLGDRPRRAPCRLTVIDHDRDDAREATSLRVIPPPPLPHARDVLPETEDHEPVGTALVLDQEVEDELALCDAGREDQVALELAHALVDVVAFVLREAGPVDPRDQLGGQQRLQEARRLLCLPERVPEQRVVRGSLDGLAHAAPPKARPGRGAVPAAGTPTGSSTSLVDPPAMGSSMRDLRA